MASADQRVELAFELQATLDQTAANVRPPVPGLRLIDGDPAVSKYANQMIAHVSATKPCRKRHLQSVEQMLRPINEVPPMASEFGAAMVAPPLGAILDWTTGTPAGRQSCSAL